MAKKADISGKKLIGLAPNDWVRWATGVADAEAESLISEEFQWVSRESDILIRVVSPTVGVFVVLFELQLYHKHTMPRRLRAYAGLAEEKYQLPVYPVLINILPTPEIEIRDRYESEFLGLHARQDYRVINLWELSTEDIFKLQLSSLLPVIPLTKDGDTEAAVQRALSQLRADETLREDDRWAELETLLRVFASFVMKNEILSRIMGVNMLEAVREESVVGQIVQTEVRSLMLRQLKHRLGEIDSELTARINALSSTRAEVLAEDLLDFKDKNDLLTWLNQEPMTEHIN
jgi:predicted transposase YdaD